MCVHIGHPLFSELRIAHSGLRKGRRDGPDSIAKFARKVSVSNGIHSRSFFGAVGWVDRQERWYERFREIGQENSRWIRGDGRLGEGRPRRRAGGAQAQVTQSAARIHVMPCSVSCRYPVGACGEYQSVAKWREVSREFVCCFTLSAKNFCGLAQRLAPALWFCNQVCSVKKYTFVKVQRWFAVALDFQLWIQPIRLFRLLQGPRAQGIRI